MENIKQNLGKEDHTCSLSKLWFYIFHNIRYFHIIYKLNNSTERYMMNWLIDKKIAELKNLQFFLSSQQQKYVDNIVSRHLFNSRQHAAMSWHDNFLFFGRRRGDRKSKIDYPKTVSADHPMKIK